MEDEKVKVTFEQNERSWITYVARGATLLDAARACGAPVHTLCNGIGACVQCKVRVDTDADHLSPPNALEKDRLGNIFHLTRERLACQCEVVDEVTIVPLEPRLPKRERSKKRRPLRRR